MTTKEVAEKSIEKEKILCPHCGKELDSNFIAKSFNHIFGRIGGLAKSAKKAASSAANGLKGGRPKNLRGGRPKKQKDDTL